MLDLLTDHHANSRSRLGKRQDTSSIEVIGVVFQAICKLSIFLAQQKDTDDGFVLDTKCIVLQHHRSFAAMQAVTSGKGLTVLLSTSCIIEDRLGASPSDPYNSFPTAVYIHSIQAYTDNIAPAVAKEHPNMAFSGRLAIIAGGLGKNIHLRLR